MGPHLIPDQYAWLKEYKAPKMLVAFMSLYGVKEVVGKEDNPIILEWAETLGIKEYNKDEIPWCGLFMAYVCHLAGKPIVDNPLWAMSWKNFGVKVEKGDERLGDILVYERRNKANKLIGGHVGEYCGEDKYCFHTGGGNQKDSSGIVRIAKNRLVACRRPAYTNMPKEVKKIYLNAAGLVSDNEA